MQTPLRYAAALFALLLTFPLAQAEETRGRFPVKMTVTVVDEAGKPITHANGFHRFGRYIGFQVDENGIFEIEMMSHEEWEKWPTADFTVKAEGYGPFSAHFKEDPIIPDIFTVVLKPAQKIGGIVIDDDGNPVEDVTVNLTIYFATSYKVESPPMVAHVETKTDADGMWSIFHLPATFNQSPYFSLKKEGFLQTTVADIPVAQLNPDATGQFNETIALERGYTFFGRVIDEAGMPIEGASVQHGIEYWNSDYKQVHTDDIGNFRLENLRLSDQALLIAHAPGKAPQMLFVEIRSEGKPIEIVMKPGRKLTFDVSDSSGKPLKDVSFRVATIDGLPGSRSYHSLPFLQENNTTDESGRFVWNDAPDTVCEMSCSLRNYISANLFIKPEHDTVAVTLYRSLIKLNILDDETVEPIPAFVVTQKMYSTADSDRASSRSMPEAGHGGTMEKHFWSDDYRACSFDIQAPGYKTTDSRKVILGEEDAVVEVRMKKGAESVPTSDTASPQPETGLFPLSGGMILTPDGKPAANATVEITAASNLCGPPAKPINSDETGKFIHSDDQHRSIGPQEFVLTITHSSGAAVVDGKDFRIKHDCEARGNAEPIRLMKWGRIEGTLQAGDRKLEGTSVQARWNKPDTLPVAPSFNALYRGTTTKQGGRFVLEQVMPGTVKVTRYIRGNEMGSAWSSYVDTVEVRSGETTVYALGATGRTVVGRATVPETIDFSRFTARIVVKPDNLDDLITPKLPRELWPDPFATDPNSCNLARLAWDNTPEGKDYAERLARNNAAEKNMRFAFLRKDGTFRFDGLPAGEYALVISLTANCGMGFEVGDWHRRSVFTVSDAEEKQPLDLGELALEWKIRL